jgi:hypothetical protein
MAKSVTVTVTLPADLYEAIEFVRAKMVGERRGEAVSYADAHRRCLRAGAMVEKRDVGPTSDEKAG